MKRKLNFIKFAQFWGIVFLLVTSISVLIIDATYSYRDFVLRADQIRSDYLDRQKQVIKQEVIRAVEMIRHQKSKSEELTRKKIKSRVYEAYAIAQNIYQQKKDTETNAEIQEMVLNALRPIRFENGKGYYFATRFDGIEVLFADRPQMEGLSLLDMRDTRGQYVIKDMIEIARQYGEGFYEYHWTKPGSSGNDFKKISFIKRFEPWGWFIGTGLYVEDIENEIEGELLSSISRIRFGKEGYIFVNEFNGDALVSNGKLFSGTKKLWEVFSENPEKMKEIFEKEYNAALKPEGDYIYYSHIKLTDPEKESQKVSFILGLPEFQWLVGAGVYFDDVEKDIAKMQAHLNKQITTKSIYFMLTAITILGLLFLLFSWLNTKLHTDIRLFISFFEAAADTEKQIDRKDIKFIEFDQMAEYANKMLANLKSAADALRESEQRWHFALEGAGDGLWDWNAQTNKVFYSRQWKNMLGFEETEIGDTLDEWDKRIHPEDRNYVYEEINKHFSGETPIYKSEHRVKCKDGTYKWILNRGKVIAWTQEKKPLRIIGTQTDITDRKRAEVERKNLENQLLQVQKLESIGQLAGGVAHDLNNLLTPILGYSELLLDEAAPDDADRESLNEIVKAGMRARDLVRKLLAFSRKQVLEYMPTDLNSIVAGLKNLLRRTIPEDIHIEIVTSSADLPVTVDIGQIEQVILNLAVNAADAMPDGGTMTMETAKVYLDEAYAEIHNGVVPGAYALLAVSDMGHGMDKETRERVFEPFFSTKGKQGTGLGLSTVYGIIKQHGGNIWVYSEIGKGATFKVYLPLSDQMRLADHTTKKTAVDWVGTETILLVEDNKQVRELALALLRRKGYNVITAEDGREALDALDRCQGAVHLLLTDVVMPVMNGRDLFKKAAEKYAGLKVLFMSGYTDNVIAHRGVLDQGVDFIQKPFTVEDLATKVREVLDDEKSENKQ